MSKVAYTLHLSEDACKKIGVSQSEIKKTSKEYKLIKQWGLQGELILKGDKGKIAFSRADFDYKTNKDNHKLITEVPLDLTVTEQRDWVAYASKFFKSSIKEFESGLSEEDFVAITKKPYFECRAIEAALVEQGITDPVIMRSRTYADGNPKGTGTKATKKKEYRQKRNKWVKEKYHKRQCSQDDSYLNIQNELEQLPLDYFGDWPDKKRNANGKWEPVGRDPRKLKPDAIKSIVQRKS